MAKKATLDALAIGAQAATDALYGDAIIDRNPMARMMLPFVAKARQWQQREWNTDTPVVTAKLSIKLFKEAANVIV